MAFCCCDNLEYWYMGNSIETQIYYHPIFNCIEGTQKTPILEELQKDFKIINRWAEHKSTWTDPLGFWNEAYVSGQITPEKLYGIWTRNLIEQIPGITLNFGLLGEPYGRTPKSFYTKTDIRGSGILWRQNLSHRCLNTCPNGIFGDPSEGNVWYTYFPIGSTMNPWETNPFADSQNKFQPPYQNWKIINFNSCLQSVGTGTGDQDPLQVWCPSGICRTAVCEQPRLSYCCSYVWDNDCAEAASKSFTCLYNGKAKRPLTPVGLTGPWPHFWPNMYFKTSEPKFTPASIFENCNDLCDTFSWQDEIDCTEKSYTGINRDTAVVKYTKNEWTDVISYTNWTDWTDRNLQEGCLACIYYWDPSSTDPCYSGITASKGWGEDLKIYCTGGSLTEDKCNCIKNNVLLPGTTFTVNIESNVNYRLASLSYRVGSTCRFLKNNIIKCDRCRVGINGYFASNHGYFDTMDMKFGVYDPKGDPYDPNFKYYRFNSDYYTNTNASDVGRDDGYRLWDTTEDHLDVSWGNEDFDHIKYEIHPDSNCQ